MKLHRLCDVQPNPSGLICRQSRWGGVAFAIIFSLPLIGVPIYSWWADKGRVFGVILALVGVFVIPWMIGDARIRFRPTNWLARICADGLWLNLRSYQDESPTDSVSVVQLDYGEIAEVSEHIEKYTTPGEKGGSVVQKLVALDMRLHRAETTELAAAIKDNRHRLQPLRLHFGFIKTTHGLTINPVSLPEPDLVRVAWQGGPGYGAVPSLRHVLSELSPYVTQGEATRRDTKNWHLLSDDELGELILRLVKEGDQIAAIDLLVRRKGLTVTQAHEFVEKIEGQV